MACVETKLLDTVAAVSPWSILDSVESMTWG